MRPGVCKHFNGIQHATCVAGLNIRSVTGGDDFGWARRIPCFAEHGTKCERYEDLAPEDLAKEEAEFQKLVDQMTKAAPFIREMKAKHKRGGSGVAECPVCGGRLHWSIAACNGHMHGKCETGGCLDWME